MKKIRLHRRLPRAQTSDFEICHRSHYFLKSPQDKINRREARSLDCLGPARNLILSSTTESNFPMQPSILKVIDKSTLVYAPLQVNDLPFPISSLASVVSSVRVQIIHECLQFDFSEERG